MLFRELSYEEGLPRLTPEFFEKNTEYSHVDLYTYKKNIGGITIFS
jgi:hypothetical protein